MGVYSTLHVTRSKAKEVILQRFSRLTDRELEQFLDVILEPQLNNCRIVEDSDTNDDDRIQED